MTALLPHLSIYGFLPCVLAAATLAIELLSPIPASAQPTNNYYGCVAIYASPPVFTAVDTLLARERRATALPGAAWASVFPPAVPTHGADPQTNSAGPRPTPCMRYNALRKKVQAGAEKSRN